MMEIFLILLLGLSALSGATAANPCLDPTDTGYSCELSTFGFLRLNGCGITDDDVEDLASCLDDIGRENIEFLNLNGNALTTLPDGIFGDLTSMTDLSLSSNAFTTLPDGIFEDLPSLEWLDLASNALTTLPGGIFGDLTSLEYLSLHTNAFTTLPDGIFGGLVSLEWLSLFGNALTTLPNEIFGDLTSLERLGLHDNALTTLPDGIFGDLTSLENLTLEGNSLECLPITPTALVELGYDASTFADGIRVDLYGDNCGCSIVDVTDNVCGEEACIPGEFGYTCAATLSPVPAPTEAPASATLSPVPAPTEAPAPATPAPNPSSEATSTMSDGEMTTAAPVVGGGTDGGSNVVASTGSGGGLADWVSVLIGAASLFVAVFATWYGYRTYQWQQQDRRGQR